MHPYGKFITISGLIIASGYTVWGLDSITPEERLARSLIQRNEAISEANSARVEAYTVAYDLCRSTASGTSEEILEILRDCKAIEEPKLEPLVTTGSTTITWTASLTPISEVPLWIKQESHISAELAKKKQSMPKKESSTKNVSFAKKIEPLQSLEKNSKNTKISSYFMKIPPHDVCKGWENAPKRVILHYTATHDDVTVQTIANGHKARFWVEYFIAYHYLIKEDGSIVNTRPEDCWSIAVISEEVNRSSIQIAYIGDDKPNDRQIDSLAKLTRDIQKRYSLPLASVDAHADIQSKNHKESMEWMFGSKEAFIKLLRLQDSITIYGKSSPELTYLWQAWGDLDLIGTWFQESRISHVSVWDGWQAHGYCQINKAQNPGWFKEYKTLKTMQERLNYCHELYVYAQGKPKGVWGTFHGYYDREKHKKNIVIK